MLLCCGGYLLVYRRLGDICALRGRTTGSPGEKKAITCECLSKRRRVSIERFSSHDCCDERRVDAGAGGRAHARRLTPD
ncbi:hypothetical protein GUJ93_ZPchr0006g46214 [Zizania palustris]|uniref:Uncharacterized protein n=1 Tax=Zizania palustris TaxID=103762 RepID=A0A8J5SAA2_ZIZPA|nr:hypothetical protein GUJ93_ZPchr0006g46214 [Zizania palustris]